jgi:hypothetical protein
VTPVYIEQINEAYAALERGEVARSVVTFWRSSGYREARWRVMAR